MSTYKELTKQYGAEVLKCASMENVHCLKERSIGDDKCSKVEDKHHQCY
jgi:hypothetical protein